MKKAVVLVLAAAFGSAAAVLAPATAAPDTVVATVPVGDRPLGLAVDDALNKVYVSNESDHNVMVIDGTSDAVLEIIPVGSFPRGVAVHEASHRVYVANQSSDTVTIIDALTDAVLDTVAVGSFPFSIAINQRDHLVYVSNAITDDVSIIDGATGTVVDTVPVGDWPFRLGAHQGTGKIYVPNRNDGTLSVIDPATNAVVAVVPVLAYPNVVKFDESTDRAFVASGNTAEITVLDTATDVVVDTIVFPEETAEIEVNEGARRLYVSQTGQFATDFRGVLVVDLDTYALLEAVPSVFGPTVLDTNATMSRMYGALHNADAVLVYGLAPPPAPGFDDLIELILSLGVHHGTETALLAKARAAEAAVARGAPDVAAHILDAFARQVEAQTGKKIGEGEAAQLLALVAQLTDAISAPLPRPGRPGSSLPASPQ